MLKFEIVKDVDSNDVDGGCIVFKVNEDGVVRNVVLGFDWGDSLCSVSLEDEEVEVLENVFSKECVERLWNLDVELNLQLIGEVEMMKFNIDELKMFSVDDVEKLFGVDSSEVVGGGVFRINIGSRGEVEEVVKVDVVDGVFEVLSEEEMKLEMMEEFEIFVDGDSNKWKMIDEFKEELDEWIGVELVNGVVSISRFEEDGDEIVKVEKQR